MEFGQFILTDVDWYHFLRRAHAFVASNLTLVLATSSGGVCFVLYVGGNLTIVDSYFCNSRFLFLQLQKIKWIWKITTNVELASFQEIHVALQR